MTASYNILFIQEPSYDSSEWINLFNDPSFNIIKHILIPNVSTTESFIEFLQKCERDNKPIHAIFGGFPAFYPIGGLTENIIDVPVFYKNVKCITLCSRGVNFIDIGCLNKHNIKLFHYDDSSIPASLKNFQLNQVSNDVADCAMWHVLEGYRKFSSYMRELIATNHTIKARQNIILKNDKDYQLNKFAFGHELSIKQNKFITSPRGQKVLIMGMGSIGIKIAEKLHYGLDMEVHYTKRIPFEKAHDSVNDQWIYHPMSTLHDDLYQFDTIVVSLPGTSETNHLINSEFLKCCKKEDLILVNTGRATVFDMSAIEESMKRGQIRHIGMDVFTKEPTVDDILLNEDYLHSITVTPHIGSGTEQVFDQSTSLAINQLKDYLINPK